jgi:hypothetical protein
MRALNIAAGAALALSACNQNEAGDTAVNADQDLAAQNIAANDTTAIDAATGDDANIAADVNFAEFDNLDADEDAADNSSVRNEP